MVRTPITFGLIDPDHVVERLFQVRLPAVDGLFLVERGGGDVHRLVEVLDVGEAHVGAAALRAVDEHHRVLDALERDDAAERHARAGTGSR